jgi:hypothetical protein
MRNTYTRSLAIAAIVASCASWSQLAAAADPKAKPKPKTKTAELDERTEYKFDDDLIHAEALTPEGGPFYLHKDKKGDSLVRARESFVVQMLKSVEQL